MKDIFKNLALQPSWSGRLLKIVSLKMYYFVFP